jgi:hypothetical protein
MRAYVSSSATVRVLPMPGSPTSITTEPRPNSVLSESELTDLVARHRHVDRVLSLPYRHFAPLATDAKNRRNRELLILATRQRNRR